VAVARKNQADFIWTKLRPHLCFVGSEIGSVPASTGESNPKSQASKSELQALAMKEGRSIAQVCEAFMRGGLEAYKKEGSKYLQRFLSRRKESPP